MTTISQIILINLYWLSLPLIGYVVLRLLNDIKKSPKPLKQIACISLRQNPLIVYVLSFATFCFIFSVISIPLYLLHTPVFLAVIIYLVMLITSIIYLTYSYLRNYKKPINLDVFHLRNQTLLTKLVFILVFLLLIGDYLIAIYVKSGAYGDAFYHVSRVVDMVANGFNTQSSFQSTIPEGAYHYNAFYAIFATCSRLLNLHPMKVWEYSYGFFRLLQWTAIFALAWTVFSRWLRVGKNVYYLSLLTLIAAISFFSIRFHFAIYPDNIVLAWLILLVIALSILDKTKIKSIGFVLIALGFLITMFHPSYGVIASCFIVLVAITRLIIERKCFVKEKEWLAYLATIISLMIGPLVTKLVPVRLTSDRINLTDASRLKVLGMYMLDPSLQPVDYISRFILVAGVIVTVFLLIKLWRDKKNWAIAFSLLFFYILVAYEPIGFTLLNRFIPAWVISNFTNMNVLVYVYVAVAVYAVYEFIKWIISGKSNSLKKYFDTRGNFLIFITVLFICIQSPVFGYSYKYFIADRGVKRVAYARFEQTEKDYGSFLKGNQVVVANMDESYNLTGLFPIDVIDVTAGHTPLAMDSKNRQLCLNNILSSFHFSDLKATHAKYVMVTTKQLSDILNTKPYLRFIKKSDIYYLYEVLNLSVYNDTEIYQPCLLYQKNERS